MAQFRNIGIIGRLGSTQVLDTIRRLKKFLLARHLHVILEDTIAEVLPGHGLQTSSRKILGEVCDLVLHPGKSTRMIEFELFIDGQFVCSQKADGLIVATPTGSTAYALSAGGPIMHPKLDAIVIVPMYPHTLSSRPIVVDGNSELKIVVSKDLQLYPQVSCDGQNHFTCAPGDTVTVAKRPQKLRLIHPLDHNYYEVCRNKLGWGSRLGGGA